MGTSIKPFAWQPYTTTGSTATGTAILTIDLSVKDKFRDGDNISVSSCPSCTLIISGGGTNTLTLDAKATTTNPSALITVGLARYSATSSEVVNTLGTDLLLVGAAATGYGDWSSIYDGPGRYPTISQIKAISSYGGRSATFASRLSDTPTTSGLNEMENVVHLAILDRIPTNIVGGGWNLYQQANLYSLAQPTTNALGFQQEENSIYNQWISPKLDPYQTNVTAYTENLRLDCGIDSGSPRDCSSALHIINNGARYKSGVIFGSNSLDTTATVNGIGEAIAMPFGYGIAWYTSAGNPAWQFASATSATFSPTNQILLYPSEFRVGPNASISTTGPSGSTNRYFGIETLGSIRWTFGSTNTLEHGGNVGTDFAIARFDDSGNYQNISLFIQRATGNVGINRSSASYPLDVSGTVHASTSVISPQISLSPLVYNALPTCAGGTGSGTIAYIIDSNVAITSWHQSVTAGGGTNKAFVACNGTGWHAFDY